MTQQGYRHRILVVDRSGSIWDILEGQQKGLSEFLAGEAKQGGAVTVSIWDFDTEIACRYHYATPQEAGNYRIEPRGGTALFDAVGDAVLSEGEKLAQVPEAMRPEDVTLIISTDGMENSSRRHTGDKVKEMLAHQQDAYKWRVLFMGAGLEAFDQHEQIGVAGGLSVNYVKSSTGSANSWRGASQYLSRVPVAGAAGGQLDFFSAEERSIAESGEEQEGNVADAENGQA